MVQIEVLKSEDLAEYKALIVSCFGQSNSMEAYQKYRENAGYEILVAKEGSRILGSVTQYAIDLFTFGFQPCLMLFNVAVSPASRRKGIGKIMLDHVIQAARDKGVRSISLTCLADALPAHRLYESAGFRRTDSVKYNLDL